PPIIFASVEEPASPAAEQHAEVVPQRLIEPVEPELELTTAVKNSTAAQRARSVTEFRPAPPPVKHSLSDPVARALVQQFSDMQQQNYEHTQQLLAAMSRAFSTAHSRQLELIRGELFRVHEVNCQLQQLNLELTICQQAPPGFAGSHLRSD